MALLPCINAVAVEDGVSYRPSLEAVRAIVNGA
jgi:hypothetical protein